MDRPAKGQSVVAAAPARAGSRLTVPVIILGNGLTVLGTLRSLGRQRIPAWVVGAKAEIVRRSRYYRKPWAELPESEDPKALAEFLERAPFECAVLMPCSDRWSKAASGLPASLDARFPRSMPPDAVFDLFVDKLRFSETLDRFDVPKPVTHAVTCPADLAPVGTEKDRVWFLKPCNSQLFSQRFHRKALPVADRADAETRLAIFADAGLSAVLQEYVPGPATAHYFVDGFVDRKGDFRAIFARRRVRMHPSDFGNSTLMVSVRPEEAAGAIDSLRRLLAGVEYRGIFSAEFKLDARDGLFKILEVNSRPWWYIEFADLCGVDVARLAYLDALGRDVPSIPSYVVGRRLVYWAADTKAFLEARREGRLGWLAWMRSWIGAPQAVFRWSDPMPSVAAWPGMLAKLVHRNGKGS